MSNRSFSDRLNRHLCVRLAVAALALASIPARGVILYGTNDPTANTTAPTGALQDSGWQYEGMFGSFLGTPIAPNYFVTAKHFQGETPVGTNFVYQGTNYTTTAVYNDPNSDLAIFQVSGTFAAYAPLYLNPNPSAGTGLAIFGRGGVRGNAVTVGADQHLGGWLDNPRDGVKRWGTNNVTQVVTAPGLGSLLYATFDASGGFNEAQLSDGDSGGGVFIQDADGTWKLAGINYGIDGPFYRSNTDAASNPAFNAALFDSTGLYERLNDGTYVDASNPSGLYATDIAADLAFIASVVPEPSSVVLSLVAGTILLASACRKARAC